MVTVAVSQAIGVPSSQTSYWKVSVPTKSKPGVYKTTSSDGLFGVPLGSKIWTFPLLQSCAHSSHFTI